MWLVLGGCQCVRGHHTHTQTAMCQLYYSHCCLTQQGKAALLLPLALILLPTKYVFGIHRLAFCCLSFSHSASLPASPVFDTHLLFLLLQFYLCYSACVYLYICLRLLFRMRTNGDRHSGSNPVERHADPRPSYHMLPEDFPCLFYIVL